MTQIGGIKLANRKSKEELQRIVDSVQKKIEKYTEARRIAETAFDKMKESSDWKDICEQFGYYESSDFGDWTC